MGTNPTQRRRRRKLTPPDKPYPEFPLGYHASGKFIKKINKQIYYFGAWAKRVNKELVLVEDASRSILQTHRQTSTDTK